MKILRVKKLPLFDVFTGEGWLNWSRVLKQGDHLKIIDGKPLNSVEKFAVQSKVKDIDNA